MGEGTMEPSAKVKIKTLPRPEDSQRTKGTGAPRRPTSRSQFYLGKTGIAVILFSLILLSLTLLRREAPPKPALKTDSLASRSIPSDRISATVNRYIIDAKLKEEIMRRRREVEVQQTIDRTKNGSESVLANDDDQRMLGVRMDHENTSERLYEQLHGNKSENAELTPDAKITAKLANRIWLSELERTDRINFVKKFIREAYDKGYEVEIDQNLVVVGVKKITQDRKVNIDQVLDRLAKEGQ
jgi:hypothetical protein